MRNPLVLLAITVSLAACVTVNKTILDPSFMDAPVPKETVHIYLPGDDLPEHTRVALLHAEGDVDITDEAEMIDALREEAGKLGANAIVLGEIRDPGTGERIAAVIFETTAERRGQAIAIFVPSLGKG